MIEIRCICGKRFRVPDAKAGARGKCPGCGGPITVPGGGAAPTRSPAAAPFTGPCPICRSTYAPGIVICLTCGIDLRTGKPLPPPEDEDIPLAELNDGPGGIPLAQESDPAPRVAAVPVAANDPPLEVTRSAEGVLQLNFEAASPAAAPPAGDGSMPAEETGPAPADTPETGPLDPDLPRRPGRRRERRDKPLVTSEPPREVGFARLVLNMYIHPISTMESLTWTLSSWPMLMKMSIFYAGSLSVLFLNAWLNPDAAMEAGGEIRAMARAETPLLGGPPFKETERYPGDFVLNVEVDPPYPQVGKRTRIKTEICDNLQAKPLKGKVTADILYEGWQDPERAAKPDEVGHRLPFSKGARKEEFFLDYEFEDGGAYQVILHITPEPPADPKIEAAREPADYEYGFVVTGYAKSRGASVASFLIAFFTVVSSVFGLLITAACVNLAGRVIGSGGTFAAMLVVLAFLTGVVNYTMTAMLILTPLLGPGAPLAANLFFVGWRTLLFLLALMKVYDVDAWLACAIAFFSNQIQLWVAFWILGSMVKMAA